MMNFDPYTYKLGQAWEQYLIAANAAFEEAIDEWFQKNTNVAELTFRKMSYSNDEGGMSESWDVHEDDLHTDEFDDFAPYFDDVIEIEWTGGFEEETSFTYQNPHYKEA